MGLIRPIGPVFKMGRLSLKLNWRVKNKLANLDHFTNASSVHRSEELGISLSRQRIWQINSVSHSIPKEKEISLNHTESGIQSKSLGKVNLIVGSNVESDAGSFPDFLQNIEEIEGEIDWHSKDSTEEDAVSSEGYESIILLQFLIIQMNRL